MKISTTVTDPGLAYVDHTWYLDGLPLTESSQPAIATWHDDSEQRIRLVGDRGGRLYALVAHQRTLLWCVLAYPHSNTADVAHLRRP